MPSQVSKRKLIDVREVSDDGNSSEARWANIGKVELRDDRNGDLHLIGYASTFDEYEMYGGPENYGWIEQLSKDAFTRTLSEKPDLQLLINHGGMPLARTTSGNLTLTVDQHGLHVDALLDRTDPDVQALVPKMLRGDMDQMSFAFRVKAQEWSAAPGFEDDPMSKRLITEVSLQKGDVSIVNYGANPYTEADLATVNGAVGVLASAPLAEVRAAQGLDADVVRAAAEHLATIAGQMGAVRDSAGEQRGAGAVAQGKAQEALQLARSRADGVTTIAQGLRIEVTGEGDATLVQLHDASGLLDAGLCAVLANEVREAVLGKRSAVTSHSAPAAAQGYTMPVAQALHLTGRTERVQELYNELGIQPTVSIESAQKAAEEQRAALVAAGLVAESS